MSEIYCSSLLSDLLCIPHNEPYSSQLKSILSGNATFKITNNFLKNYQNLLKENIKIDSEIDILRQSKKMDELESQIQSVNFFKEHYSDYFCFFYILNNPRLLFKTDQELQEITSLFLQFDIDSQPMKTHLLLIKKMAPFSAPNRREIASKISNNALFSYEFTREINDLSVKKIDVAFIVQTLDSLKENVKRNITLEFIGTMTFNDFHSEIFTPLCDKITEERKKDGHGISYFTDGFNKAILAELLIEELKEVHGTSFDELTIKSTLENYFRWVIMTPEIFGIKEWLSVLAKSDKSVIFKANFLFNEVNMKNILNMALTYDELENMEMEKVIKRTFPVQLKAEHGRFFIEFWYGFSKLFDSLLFSESDLPAADILIEMMKEGPNELVTRLNKHNANPYIDGKREQGINALLSIVNFLKQFNVTNPNLKISSLFYDMEHYYTDNTDKIEEIENFADLMETFISLSIPVYELLKQDSIEMPEYQIIDNIITLNFQWHVSIKEGITIQPPGATARDRRGMIPYSTLKLAVSKLNVAEGGKRSGEIKAQNCIKFVKRFQEIEVLKSKLINLKKYDPSVNRLELTFNGIEDDDSVHEQISKIISRLHRDVDLVLNKLRSKQFTKELVCVLHHLIKTKNIEESIAVIVGSTGCTKSFAEKFIYNVKIELGFENFVNELDDYFENLEIDPILTESMKKGKTIKCSCEEQIVRDISRTLDYSVLLKDAQKLSQTILFIYMYFQETPPFFNQTLICTPETTMSRMKSFFSFFKSADEPLKPTSKCNNTRIFMVVDPQNLEPSVLQVFNNLMNKIKSYPQGRARIILTTAETCNLSMQAFNSIIYKVPRAILSHTVDYSELGSFYLDKSSKYMQSYLIYNCIPRCGKSQLIMKKIYELGKHTYTRILVDNGTSLKKLIKRLRSAPVKHGYKTCIHLNISGTINKSFELNILSLLLFHSLNDGEHTPFICSEDFVFFFEFGANSSCNTADDFIQTFFQLGKYMTLIEMPPAREIFSFDEYTTERIVEEKSEFFAIVKNENSRDHLKTAVAFEHMLEENKKKKFKKMKDDEIRKQYETFFNEASAEGNIKDSFDRIIKLFDQKWLQDKFKEGEPQIAQISNVAAFLHEYRDLFLLKEGVTMSKEEDSMFHSTFRYGILRLLVEQAISSNGNPYIKIENQSLEHDVQRINEYTEFIASSKKMLVCSHNKLLIIHHPSIKKEIDKEYEAKSVKNISISSDMWKTVKNDQRKLFEIINKILSLTEKRPNIAAPYHAVLIYKSLDKSSKEKINKIWDNGNIIFKIAGNQIDDSIVKGFRKLPADVQTFMNIANKIVRNNPTRFLEKKDSNKAECFKSADLFVNELENIVDSSMLSKYSLSIHNIQLIMHMIYHLETGIPIILMGETGSGKTYSVDYLAEIYGSETVLNKLVIDGGTTEKIVKQWTIDAIRNFDKTIQARITNGQLPAHFEDKKLILFFDEINTADCQWFLKTLILDRVIDNDKIPEYVKFVCAVNPYRKLPPNFNKNLRGLDVTTSYFSSSKMSSIDQISASQQREIMKELVYKVLRMPESITQYLFSADPPRAVEGAIDSTTNHTEFEEMIEKIAKATLCQKLGESSNYSTITHFSQLPEYSFCFDEEFYIKLCQNKPLEMKNAIETVISNLIIYASRLMTDKNVGFFKDPSFSSIRDAERCSKLIKFFFKFGIFEDFKEPSFERMRKAFILAFSVSFWVRLSDFVAEGSKISLRNEFLSEIIAFWKKQKAPDVFKPPETVYEWNNLIKSEYMKYTDVFVEEGLGLAKNSALSENIWITFICLMNNIPLWIIGLPGTSKSLAVNLVFQRLINKNIPCPKFRSLPSLYKQTFMCSEFSRSEALLEQLQRVASKAASAKKGIQKIPVLLLEEIGHADLSPYLPLKCLNRIIDNGYTLPSGEVVNVVLIGLSNYKMDSAKLNRGILIVRDQLNLEEKDFTSKTIFESTATMILKARNTSVNANPQQKLNELCKQQKMIASYYPQIKELTSLYHEIAQASQSDGIFIGLRDFYGIIRSFATLRPETRYSAIVRNFSGALTPSRDYKMAMWHKIEPKMDPPEVTQLDVIKQNMSEKWDHLKVPLMRHLMIPTDGIAAAEIIRDLLTEEKREVKYLFSDNFSGLPNDEWISNDLKIFSEAMCKGETIVFIGDHPCFDSLYDVFNLLYEENGPHSYALISFGGDSYSVEVNKNFRAIINIDKKQYTHLPAPFLNRFEKIPLDYRLILTGLEQERSELIKKQVMTYFKQNAKNLSTLFGCYNSNHFDALVYLNRSLQLSISDLITFSCFSIQPSKVAFTFADERIKESTSKIMLKDVCEIRSSIPQLIKFYNREKTPENAVLSIFYNNWHTLNGIQAITIVPTMQDFSPLKEFGYLKEVSFSTHFVESDVMKFSIKNQETARKDTIILIVKVTDNHEQIQQRIYHLETLLNQLRTNPPSHMKGKTLHTFIVIDNSLRTQDISFVETISWPLMFLDICISGELKKGGVSPTLEDILYSPLSNLFKSDEFDFDELFETCFTKMIQQHTDIYNSQTCKSFLYEGERVNKEKKAKIRRIVHSALVNCKAFDDQHFFIKELLTSLSNYPQSITELIGIRIARFTTNLISLCVSLFILSETENAEIEKIIETVLLKSSFYMTFITELLVFDVASRDQVPSISSILTNLILSKNIEEINEPSFNCDVLFTTLVANAARNKNIQEIKDISSFLINEVKKAYNVESISFSILKRIVSNSSLIGTISKVSGIPQILQSEAKEERNVNCENQDDQFIMNIANVLSKTKNITEESVDCFIGACEICKSVSRRVFTNEKEIPDFIKELINTSNAFKAKCAPLREKELTSFVNSQKDATNNQDSVENALSQISLHLPSLKLCSLK